MAATLLELRKQAAELEDLEAFLSMCSHCRRVRDDDGRWQPLEAFVMKREPVSHGICPECMRKHFPDQHAKLHPPGEG